MNYHKESYCCKYCGKEFEKSTQLGSHVIHCCSNPDYSEIRNLILRKTKEKLEARCPKLDFKFICPVCGKEYVVNMTQHTCESGKYKHTCSSTCAHLLSVKNTDLNKKNLKISSSLNEHIETLKEQGTFSKEYSIRICENCGKEYTFKDYKSPRYCCKDCGLIAKHKKLSAAAIKNKFGGLNSETTHKSYKRGYYKGIWCDSSWELAYLLYCFGNNISVERNEEYFEYDFEGKTYKFYPDFIVNGKLVEIKGFYTPKNIAKKEQYPNIEFIDKEKIQKYLDYAISNYGENFTELYDSED